MSGAITKKIIAEGAFAENDRYLVIVFDDPAAALQAVKRYERSAQRKDLGYAGAVNQMNQKNSELSREAEQMKETIVMDRTDVRTTIFLLLFVPWKTAE